LDVDALLYSTHNIETLAETKKSDLESMVLTYILYNKEFAGSEECPLNAYCL